MKTLSKESTYIKSTCTASVGMIFSGPIRTHDSEAAHSIIRTDNRPVTRSKFSVPRDRVLLSILTGRYRDHLNYQLPLLDDHHAICEPQSSSIP